MSRNRDAYIAVTNDLAQTVAPNADVTFNKDSPESNVEHCDGVAAVTVRKKGSYKFDYLVRGSNSSSSSTADLSFALFEGDNRLPLTSFKSSDISGTKTVTGTGIVCLDKCDEVTLRNVGESVNLVADGEVTNAVLRLVLLDNDRDSHRH